MTGRDRLGTVLRVAELRERVSRGVASADAAAARAALAQQDARAAALAHLPADDDLRRTAERAALRAGALLEATRVADEARLRSESSVAAHVAASRRTELLADLVARKRAEREAELVAADQRTVDDLAFLKDRS